MATIYAHTNDGYVARFNQSSWSNARANTAGTNVSSTGTSLSNAVGAWKAAARGGGSTFSIYRSFFFFDTSGISSNVSEATLKIRGRTFNTGDLIAVKSNSDIETLGTADFGSIVGWNTTTDGSGGGDNESNVTKYSAEISTWSSSGYNDIALNSTALADIRDDDTLYICLINTDYDLRDIEPTGSSDNRCGMYYTNYTGTSRDPYVDYTLAPTATDNSVFFGTNF
jgi:hypothetical protein|tara:strand:- start:2667 stop:3344 length:678 start_codon:yes stop_codon:yes gene_type:complete